MALSVGKLAPSAVVIAAVSCCAWPYVFSPDTSGKQAAAMPEIAPSQLSPHILPPPARDPYRPAGAPAVHIVMTDKGPQSSAAGAKGSIGARPASAADFASGGPFDPLNGLALAATSILDKQRLAVINGRIYAEREWLLPKNPDAPMCIVARILPDRVILECEGRTATLSYSNVGHARTNRAGGLAGHGAPPPLPEPPASSLPAGRHHQAPL